jgi:CheY-like chemotaxis protein
MRRIDVLPTVSGALEALSPAAEAKGIELRLDAAAASAAVLGDSERLSQVFWNLISNAIKFTPLGGHVSVGVHRDGEWIEVAVQDDGQGIATSLLPSIFDRFSQGSITRRSSGGLGLGLSIVKTIVELHGGTAKAMSDGEGRGARFVVRLPSAQPAAKERAALGALMLPASRLEGVRAVIVDDEEDARETLSFALTQQGANVVVCSSIEEVKAALSGTVPDLLIADIALSGESGLDLARWLRGHAHEPLRDLPAIALTAYAHAEDRLRALAAGFTMHVPKPVEADELAVVVASVVGRFRVG